MTGADIVTQHALDVYSDSDMIARALDVARAAHTGQLYGSDDYFTAHVIPVVIESTKWLSMTTTPAEVILSAAALHDVVEDTDVIIEEIHAEFGARVADIVALLTRSSSYITYMDAIVADIDASIVKYSDSSCNLACCISSTKKKPGLVARYSTNIRKLESQWHFHGSD